MRASAWRYGLRRISSALLMALITVGCNRGPKTEIVERDVAIPENSKPWKIASARSAGPVDIVKDATILDIAATDTSQGEELMLGSNGWTCWPDNPATPIDDPVCEDEGGREWEYAMRARRAPRIATIGLIYRLKGDGEVGPFIGVISGTQRVLAGLPVTPQVSKPWVRYAGTPYAYLVIPARRSQQ